MSQSTLAEIAALQQLSFRELQARWRELTGTDPPRYNRSFLTRRLAYRMQGLAFGGLSQRARGKMAALLAQAGCDELGRLPAERRNRRDNGSRPIVGTRFLRDWNGEQHEVTVVQRGFAYRGRRYRSLSAIARAITGTRWNGPAFFGMRGAKGQR